MTTPNIQVISDDPSCLVWRVSAGEFRSNAYLVIAEQCTILVDGGLDVESVEALIKRKAGVVDAVLLTHGHFDHIASAAMCQQKFGSRVILHAQDLSTMKSANFLLMACGLKSRITIPEPELISENLNVSINGLQVEFHHVPGHTPGSCLIEVGDFLFSGDTIYASGIGKTGFRSENFDQIRDSLIEKKEIYTRNKLICPGHGRCINGTDLFRENKKLVEFLSNG